MLCDACCWLSSSQPEDSLLPHFAAFRRFARGFVVPFMLFRLLMTGRRWRSPSPVVSSSSSPPSVSKMFCPRPDDVLNAHSETLRSTRTPPTPPAELWWQQKTIEIVVTISCFFPYRSYGHFTSNFIGPVARSARGSAVSLCPIRTGFQFLFFFLFFYFNTGGESQRYWTSDAPCQYIVCRIGE